VSDRVSTAARLRDVAAVALLAGGMGIYAYAHAGMSALAANRELVPRGTQLVDRWDYYRTASTVGLAVIAAGVVVALWSFVRHRKPSGQPSAAP